METYTSAGTILISFEERKVLLIKHPDGHWGFSKGYIEKGESPLETAKRELKEEVGITCNFYMNPNKYFFVEKYSYLDSNNNIINKNIIYYIGVTCNTEYILETVFKDCRWVEVSELYSIPTFKSYTIVNEIEELIKRPICWVNLGLKNNVILKENIMPSKHIFSRVIPLVEFSDKVRIKNAPNIMDSYYMYRIIKKSKVLHGQPMILYEEDVGNCWSTVNILPFLVYNHKKILLKSKPTGCKIGQRSIKLYLDIMKKFGFSVKTQKYNNIEIKFCKCNEDLTVTLPFPSFTGTSMAIYCALLNEGKTYLKNISLEPEILFLINIIKEMGWEIRRKERDLLIFPNYNEPRNVEIIIPPDRNVVVTRIVDCLINKQPFYFSNEENLYLTSLLHYFDEIGVKYKYKHNSIEIYENQLGNLKDKDILCDHYPALCSDWQPMLAYLALKNKGQAKIIDNVFENRFGYFEQISSVYSNSISEINNNIMIAKMDNKLQDSIPNSFECLDIRASAVLIMLMELEIECKITNLKQLLRGYENVAQISPLADVKGYYEFD
ncbi:MAG: NUDIX domain-containing protein [Clostridia bacterium]|nr:NUDIX domain-containing protein [Clostridia bacterium]